jgi:lipid-A-disaccharide synthase
MSRIFIISGEISGDTHAASLMKELQKLDPNTRFLGLGGPRMKEQAGPGIEDWVESAAVVGLSEVLQRYGYFKQRFDACMDAIAVEKPDAIILIDYPGFNLRIAKAVRKANIDTKILYYISPQVWAWKKGRLKEMAETLDLMICIFPFEKALYEKSGLRTEYGGHPMMQRVKTLRRNWQRQPGLVGWFPGSRLQEVRRLFPVMMKASRLIKKQVPNARFVVSAANESLANELREMADDAKIPEAKMWIETGTVYDLMQRAEVGVIASGTATLEAACFGLPYSLIYRVAWPTYLAAKVLVRIPFIGIVNVLAGRQVVRELIQHQCSPRQISAAMVELLQSQDKREALTKDMASVIATLGDDDAYAKAAGLVHAALK